MTILKFGGTSASAWERIVPIVEQRIRARRADAPPQVVVLSALAGATNALVRAVDAAHAAQPLPIEALRRLHAEAARLPDASRRGYLARVERELRDLAALLSGIRRAEDPRATRHQALALGERLSAPLLAAGLRHAGIVAEIVDGTQAIATRDASDDPEIDDARTEALARKRLLAPAPEVHVRIVTGFIGLGPGHRTATLGRGASDLSATVLAAALGADAVELWSDVDGVFTADPRADPRATLLRELTYAEATRLAESGARVLHPRCLEPVRDRRIPVLLRNTFAPHAQGTRIAAAAVEESCA